MLTLLHFCFDLILRAIPGDVQFSPIPPQSLEDVAAWHL